MAELKISGLNFTKLLKERLPIREKSGGKITLVDTPQSFHLPITMELLRVLTMEFDSGGVYMTTMKVYKDLIEVLKANQISTDKIFFVDVISKMYGLEPAKVPNCEFISSPINIESMSKAISHFLEKITAKKKFVVFDSLTTILLYNSVPRIVEFTTGVVEHLKAQHVDTVLIMLSTAKGSTNEALIDQIKNIIDDRITIPE